MTATRITALAGLALLAGCGRVSELEPAPGQPLPVTPLMARATPTPDQLLTAPTYARPDRVDEVVRRSRPREADPFDLPPATGGAAPPAPAGTVPQDVPTDEGLTDPQ